MSRAALAALALALAPAGAARGAEAVVAFTIENAASIPEPLGGLAGDPERGRALYFERERVRCHTCHGSPGGPGTEGNAAGLAAPPLTGLADRMTEGEIRLWIAAPALRAPGTAMPAYYALGGRTDPADPLYGGPILTAQEVEDLTAWLAQQRGG